MAKGQVRGNKEPKKPKKPKQTVTAPSPFITQPTPSMPHKTKH